MPTKSTKYDRRRKLYRAYKKSTSRYRNRLSRYRPSLSNRMSRGYTGTKVLPWTPNVGLPNRKFVQLYYNEYLALTCTTGITSYNTFIINNLYDPNSTGGGHQPMGLDQWDDFFKKYRVHSATIKAHFFNNASSLTPVRCGILIDKNTSVPTYVGGKAELTKGKWMGFLSTSSRARSTITQTVKMKDFFGVNKLADNSALEAEIGGGTLPTPCYAHVWIQSADNASTSSSTGVEVSIQFNCELFDSVDVGQS